MSENPRMSREQRFNKKSGFNGNFCQEEMYLLLSRFDSDILEGVVELVILILLKLCILGIQILTILGKHTTIGKY